MEYTEDKLTEWFDVKVQKPWEPGVYEVSHKLGYTNSVLSFWNGEFFGFTCSAQSGVSNAESKGREHGATRDDIIKWRGLSSDPSAPAAPKKKSGNKRKTMYFVIDTGWGYPHSGFENLKNAQDYAENAKRPVRIIKKRFRTPEA